VIPGMRKILERKKAACPTHHRLQGRRRMAAFKRVRKKVFFATSKKLRKKAVQQKYAKSKEGNLPSFVSRLGSIVPSSGKRGCRTSDVWGREDTFMRKKKRVVGGKAHLRKERKRHLKETPGRGEKRPYSSKKNPPLPLLGQKGRKEKGEIARTGRKGKRVYLSGKKKRVVSSVGKRRFLPLRWNGD